MSTYVRKIDHMIQEKSLLKTKFYQAWSKGELSKEDLKFYALEYYAQVRAFPRYISAIHCQVECDDVRQVLLENLMEEEAGKKNHLYLWRQFAKSFGVTEEEILQHECLPTTKKAVDTFYAECLKNDPALGIAALYTYESQIPEVCISKIDGLRDMYEMQDPRAYQYFKVHIQADEKHAEEEKNLLEKLITEENFAQVEETVERILKHLNALLDGIYDHRMSVAA